ncbi:uncharacterized protein LOC126266586 [Aethina tumida]|uniref:uncharacterized protein LOC126266586 n=1 Tax=Aethina tumida TaxID=116153 RepID=UPI0021487AC0|nr:uncharacterized protein LOC126266586 [Aethina tumida]
MVIPCLMIRGDCEKVMETLKDLAVQENGRTNVNTVILQMHHEKIEFSVFGIFLLDGTLVCSIAGALVTYLVMFLQFDNI